MKVRWCPEFLGYSLLLLDKNSPQNARVHIEHALPAIGPADRPSLVAWNRRFPKTFVAFRSAFDALWDVSSEPPELTGRPAQGGDPTGVAEERRTLATVLHEFLAEGVRERNRLIPQLADFDYAAERQRLVDWSNLASERMDNDIVNVGERSRFKILDRYEPEPMGDARISEQQIHIQTMWTEKLKRLRAIIDRVVDGYPK